MRALAIETRLIFSLQPLGFNFGKQEDAHRLERKKDDLDKDINDAKNTPPKPITNKKRRRRVSEESDNEDLGLPKVTGKG